MPIPIYDGSPENEWIGKCVSEISGEYEQDQALAICYKQMEQMTEIKLAKIPVEIAGDNEEKILDYLPSVKPKETEDEYLARCVIVLYPEYVDEQQGYSLCADKYQRQITIQNNKQTMKAEKMSAFDRKKLEFQVQIALKELREKGINLAEEGGGSYPWDECIKDQTERYGDEETAKKVCGYIKSEYGS